MSFGAINLLGGTGWKNDLLNSVALSSGKKLSFTPTVTGNRRQFTIMCNVRRTTFGATQYILSAINASLAAYWHFNSDDTLDFGLNSGGSQHVTTHKFRDTEPMYLGLAFDSVARTVTMVHNDQEIDSFSTATLPVANVETVFNMAGTKMELGAYNNAAGVLGANVSDFVLLDGEVLTAQEMINYRTQNVPLGKNVITTTKKFTTEGKAARFLALHRNDPASGTTKVEDEGQYIERSTASWDTIHSDVIPSTGKYQVEVQLGSDTTNLIVGTGKATNNAPRAAVTSSTDGNFTGVSLNGTGLQWLTFNNSSANTDPAEWTLGNQTEALLSMYLDMDTRKMILAMDGLELTLEYDIYADDVRMYFDVHSLLPGATVNFGQKDYAYPKDGYGPLQEVAKSDLKRCKLIPNSSNPVPLTQRGLEPVNTGTTFLNSHGNFVLTDQKVYIECTGGTDIHAHVMGFSNDFEGMNTYTTVNAPTRHVNAFGVYSYTSAKDHCQHGATANVSIAGSSTVAGEIRMMAVDFTAGLWWSGEDGTWHSGDPETGTGGNTIPTGSDWWFLTSTYQSSGSVYNFGDTPFSHQPTGFVGPASLDFDTLRPTAATSLQVPNTDVVLSGTGNLTAAYTGTTAFKTALSTYAMNSGLFYAECTATDGDQFMIGIEDTAYDNIQNNPHSNANFHAIYGRTPEEYDLYTGGSSSDAASPFNVAGSNGAVIGVAVDSDAGMVYFRLNGVFLGDPIAKTGGTSFDNSRAYRFVSTLYGNTGVTWNFGATAYSDAAPAGYNDLDATTALQAQREYGPTGGQMLFEGADLGEVTAGNLLPWTLTGITSDDQLTDTPGDPFAVLSSLDKGPGVVISDGGLHATLTTDDRVRSTQAFKASDSFAMQAIAGASSRCLLGVVNSYYVVGGGTGANSVDEGVHYHGNGQVNIDGTLQGTFVTYTTNDVIEVCMSEGFVWFIKNGTPIQGDPVAKTGGFALPAGTDWFFSMETSSGAAGAIWDVDFGQRGYVPPTGYKTLRNSNKATPKYHGRDSHDVTLRYDPNNSDSVSVLPWKPGFSWHKLRSGISAHKIFDMLRSPELGDQELASDRNNAQGDGGQSCGIVYSDDGILYDTSVGSSNEPSALGNYMDWVWKLSDAPVLDTSGTIDANLAVAPEGHISAIQFQGTLTAGQTVPHGLPDTPEMKIIKELGGANTWIVTHKTLGVNEYLALDTNAAVNTASSINPDLDTSTLIGLGDHAAVNSSTAPGQIIYAFRSVKGLCLVTSWKGNGGIKFIPLGFRMRSGIIKPYSRTGAWAMVDSERDPINDGTNQYLLAHDTGVEGAVTYFDINAQGITLRTSSSTVNEDGAYYIGVFFADVAGGGNLPAVLGH